MRHNFRKLGFLYDFLAPGTVVVGIVAYFIHLFPRSPFCHITNSKGKLLLLLFRDSYGKPSLYSIGFALKKQIKAEMIVSTIIKHVSPYGHAWLDGYYGALPFNFFYVIDCHFLIPPNRLL